LPFESANKIHTAGRCKAHKALAVFCVAVAPIAAIASGSVADSVRVSGQIVPEFLADSSLHMPDAHAHGQAVHRESASTQAQKKLEGRMLERTRGLSLGQALQAMPGVTQVSTGANVSKPAVRGLTGNRVVILNNGIRQEAQQWGAEHAPEVDPFLASRFTLVQGASSVRYGPDALAGVVLVEPWPLLSEPGYAGDLYLIGQSNRGEGTLSGTLEGMSPKWPGLAGRVQGTLKKGGDAQAPDYGLANTGLEEANGSATLGYARDDWKSELFYSRFHTRLGVLAGSHIGNLTDLNNAIARGRPEVTRDFTYAIDRPYQEIDHQLIKLSAVRNFKAGEIAGNYAFQINDRKEYDHLPLNDARRRENRPELHFEILTHSTEWRWLGGLPLGMTIETGFDAMAQYNTYSGRAFIPNFLSRSGGVFAIVGKPWRDWHFESGARLDVKQLETYARNGDEVENHSFAFRNASAMAGAHWHGTGGFEWRGHVSTAFRPPGVNELFSSGLHHGAASVEFGDSTLKPERAYDATVDVRLNRKAFEVALAAYRTYIDGFMYLRPVLPATLTIRGAFPTFRHAQTPALFTGADASFMLRLGGGWSYHANGSVLHAIDDATGEYLPMMPAPRFENGFEFVARPAPERRVPRSLVASTVTAKLRSVLKQGMAPPASSDYAPPPDGYHLVDLAFETEWQWDALGGQRLHLDCAVTNAANVAYRDYTNRLRYFADEPGRNIMLKLRLPFGT
jgi:iron complex outermembrane recepter protein